MNDRVRTTIDGHVAEVMLDRADKHNALDMPMFEALVAAADSLASDPTVRAVVLHGAGDNFCAGIDVSMFSAFAADFDPQLLAPQRGSPGNLFQRAGFAWRELPVPVICAIQGIAWGGGLQVALGADLRYASPAASLSVMEIRWGLIPDMGITATTRGQLRSDVLKELAWTGRVVEAADAAEVGLVTAIHDDPLDAARRTAHDIASRSPDRSWRKASST